MRATILRGRPPVGTQLHIRAVQQDAYRLERSFYPSAISAESSMISGAHRPRSGSGGGRLGGKKIHPPREVKMGSAPAGEARRAADHFVATNPKLVDAPGSSTALKSLPVNVVLAPAGIELAFQRSVIFPSTTSVALQVIGADP